MTRGRKTKYHINGTKLDFESRVDLAKYFNCTVGAVAGAEARWCKQKGQKSFVLKHYRVKRINNDI